MDELYEYNGQQYTLAQLQEKYGNKTQEAISKFGFKKITNTQKNNEPKFTYEGQEYSYSELQDKYGDRTQEAIDKFGFKEVGGVKKKELSTSTSQKQELASATKNTSSDSQANDDWLYEQIGEKHMEENKHKTPKQTYEAPPFAQSINPSSSQDQYVESNFKRFQKETAVSDDEIESERQAIQDEVNNRGFWNKAKTMAKEAWNATSPDWASVDVNPLSNELSQADEIIEQQKKVAKKNNQSEPTFTEEDRLQLAIDIKLNNRIQSIKESKERDFLKDAQNTTLGDKTTLKDRLLDLNERKATEQIEITTHLATKDYETEKELNQSIKQLGEITSQIKTLQENNQEVPQSLRDEYTSIYQDANSTLAELSKTKEELSKSQAKVDDFKHNLDAFKRDYGYISNLGRSISTTLSDIGYGNTAVIETALDYTGLSEQNYFGALAKDYLSNKRRSYDATKELGLDGSDEYMKPIQVDDINSAGDFGSWLVNDVAGKQVLNLAIASTGAPGIASIGLSSGGQKRGEMLGEMERGEKQYSASQQILAPLAFGGSEMVGAYIDKIALGRMKSVVKSANPGGRKLIAENAWKELAKQTGRNVRDESIEEVGVNIFQNTIDKYLLEDENVVNITDGTKDVLATTVALTSMLGLGGGVGVAVKQSIRPFSYDNKMQKVNSEILRLEQELGNANLSEQERNLLSESLDKANQTANDLLKSTLDNMSQLSESQFNEILNIEKEQVSLREKAREIKKSKNITSGSKKMILNSIETDFDALETKRLDILKNKTEISGNDTNDNAQLAPLNIDENEGTQRENTTRNGDVSVGTIGMDERRNSDRQQNQEGNINQSDNTQEVDSNTQSTRSEETIKTVDELFSDIETEEDLETMVTEENNRLERYKTLYGDNSNEVVKQQEIVDELSTRQINSPNNESLNAEIEETAQETSKPEMEETAPKTKIEPETDNKQKPVLITRGRNEYTISNNNGILEVVDKNGKVPSKKTEREVLREYSDKYDFTEGENYKPETVEETYNPDEEIANNSNNPSQLAEVALRTKTKSFVEENSNTDAIQIIEYVNGNVKRGKSGTKGQDGSFIGLSDSNNISYSIAKTYLRSDGRGLDVLAKELTEIMGREVTEQDIIDTMLMYPNGINDVTKEVRDMYSSPAKNRFTELTGFPANDYYLEKAVEQARVKEELRLETENNYLLTLTDEQLAKLYDERQAYEKAINQGTESVNETRDTKNSQEESRVLEETTQGNGGSPDSNQNTGQEIDEGPIPFSINGSFTEITKKQFKKLINQISKAFPSVKGKITLGENAILKRLNELKNKGFDTQYQVDYKALADQNKYTQPKVPTRNIFNHKSEFIYVSDNDLNESKKETRPLNLSDLVPTQKNVTINNLKEVVDISERPEVVQTKGKFYILDGHHRAANAILSGETSIEVDLFNLDNQIQFLKTEQGEVYGFVDPENGNIYLDDNKMNANTPFHEIAGHTFLNILKETNPKSYNEIIKKLSQETEMMNEVRNDPAYAHLKTDEQIADELFARLIGNQGESMFNSMTDKSLVEKIKDTINKLWEDFKQVVGANKDFGNIRDWSVEDFKSATLNDILNNVTKNVLEGKEVISGKTSNATNAQFNVIPFKANSRNKHLYNKALDMFYAKNSLEDIWQETGFFLRQNTSNNQWEWAYRIDQNKIELNFPNQLREGMRFKLSSGINFTDFFAIFPNAKDITVRVVDRPSRPSVMDMSKDGRVLTINLTYYKGNETTKQKAKQTIAHELQHYIQTTNEKSNPPKIGRREKDTYRDGLRALQNARRSSILDISLSESEKATIQKKIDNIQKAINYLNGNNNVSLEIKRIVDDELDKRYYYPHLTEREARLAETDFTKSPYQSYNEDARELKINTLDFESETAHLRNSDSFINNNSAPQLSVISNAKAKVAQTITTKKPKGRDISNTLNESTRVQREWMSWLRRQFNNTFKSSGSADKKTFEIVRGLDRREAHLYDVIGKEINWLEKLLKKNYRGKSLKEKQAIRESVNAFLSGDRREDMSFLSDEDIQLLSYFRSRIDVLSNDIILELNKKLEYIQTQLEENPDSNSLREAEERTTQLIQKIEDSKGKYLTRDYEIFHNKNYLKQITKPYTQMSKEFKDKYDNAVQYILDQSMDLFGSEITLEDARHEVSKYLDEIKRSKDLSGYVSSTQKGAGKKDFLKKRKDLPKEFRDLLGESIDPIFNYANTIFNMSNYLGNIAYQEKIRDHIMSSGIGKMKSENGHTLVAPTGENWNVLDGIYVPQEFKDALDDLMPLGRIEGGFMKWWITLSSYTKIGKTVLSPTTALRNMYSGVILALNTGHLPLLNLAHAKTATTQSLNKDKAYDDNLRQELYEENVIGDGINSGELRATLNDFSKRFDRMMNKSPLQTGFDYAQTFYAFGDDFYKVIVYLGEKQRLMKSGMSEYDSRKKAGERTRNGFPTYSMLPRNIQGLRRFPLIGSFVSFAYEQIRTKKNNVLYAIEDFSQGRNKMGFQRATGLLAASSISTALSLATRSLLMNFGDDEEQALRETMPGFYENSNLIWTGYDDKGKPKFVDGTAFFPDEVWIKPLMTALNQRKGYDTAIQQIEAGANELLSPYISFDVFSKTVAELVVGRKMEAQNIYDFAKNSITGDYDDNWGDYTIHNKKFSGIKNFGKYINHTLRGAGPGVWNNISEFARSNNLAPGFFGDKFTSYKEYTNEDAAFALAGVRFSTVDVESAMEHRGRSLHSEWMDEVNAQVKAKLETSERLSKEDISEIVDDYFKYSSEVNEAIQRQINLGESLGIDRSDAIDITLSVFAKKDKSYFKTSGSLKPRTIGKQTKGNYIKKIQKKHRHDKNKQKQEIDNYTKNIIDFNKALLTRK